MPLVWAVSAAELMPPRRTPNGFVSVTTSTRRTAACASSSTCVEIHRSKGSGARSAAWRRNRRALTGSGASTAASSPDGDAQHALAERRAGAAVHGARGADVVAVVEVGGRATDRVAPEQPAAQPVGRDAQEVDVAGVDDV